MPPPPLSPDVESAEVNTCCGSANAQRVVRFILLLISAGTLQNVLIVTHRLGNILRGSWHMVLDTLEQAAALLTRRAIARPRWSPSSLSQTELAEVERHCMGVLQAAVRGQELLRS